MDLVRADGVRVYLAALGGDLGRYGLREGLPQIALERDVSPTVRTVTLCHELGHHVAGYRPELVLDDAREERLAEGFAANLVAIAAARQGATALERSFRRKPRTRRLNPPQLTPSSRGASEEST